jgi:hypothetical protein
MYLMLNNYNSCHLDALVLLFFIFRTVAKFVSAHDL